MKYRLSTLDQCRIMVRLASRLVPPSLRPEWQREWQAELTHAWRQLSLARSITRRQRNMLRRRCWGAFADAAWYRFNEQDLRRKIRHWSQTPSFSLFFLTTAFLAFVAASGFLPRTRSLLWPPPYPDARRIATISRSGIVESSEWAVPYGWLGIWKEHEPALEALAAYSWQPQESTLELGHRRLRLSSIRVEDDFFQVFGVRPWCGRLFQPGERATAHIGLVISYEMWQQQLEGGTTVLGKKIHLDGQEATIIGILPQRFWFPSRQVAIWRLAEPGALGQQRPVGVVARLRAEVNQRGAERELERTIANSSGYSFSTSSIEIWPVGERIHQPLTSYGLALSIALILMMAGVGSGRLNLVCRQPGLVAACRWWGFFLAKISLLLLILLMMVVEFTPEPYIFPQGRTTMVLESASLWIFSVGCVFLLWWSILDQQRRCRLCLARLVLPAQIGHSGCLFLGWAGTELVCAAGHGLLHISETDCSWVEPAQWTSLDESWRSLFNEECASQVRG